MWHTNKYFSTIFFLNIDCHQRNDVNKLVHKTQKNLLASSASSNEYAVNRVYQRLVLDSWTCKVLHVPVLQLGSSIIKQQIKLSHTLAGWASTPNMTSLDAAIFKYCRSDSSGLRPLKIKEPRELTIQSISWLWYIHFWQNQKSKVLNKDYKQGEKNYMTCIMYKPVGHQPVWPLKISIFYRPCNLNFLRDFTKKTHLPNNIH